VNLFHWHDWMICGARAGKMGNEYDVTVVLYRCPCCGDNKTEVLTGVWTVQQLLGEKKP
jgi:hypothetical protein